MDSSQEELQRLQRVVQFVKMQVHAFTSLAEGNPDLLTFLKTLRGVLTMDTNSNGTDENGLPKTRSKRKNADEVPHVPEISLLFEPLKCGICDKEFNSASAAKTHYDSKKHRNKTIVWLRGKNKGKNGTADESVENEANEGEEVMDVAQDGPPQPKKKKEIVVDENDPNRFCKTCKVKMYTDHDTKIHYDGKKHKLRVTREQQKQIAEGADQKFSVDQTIEQCIPVA